MAGRIGWFDAFREHGAPTWYGEENRTPVVLDTTIVSMLAVLALPLLAFLLVMPGFRHLKTISTLTFVLSMLQGGVLLGQSFRLIHLQPLVVCIHHPCWHESSVRIFASYKAFSSQRMEARLGVRIGLKSVNMTLSSMLFVSLNQSIVVYQVPLRGNNYPAAARTEAGVRRQRRNR